MKDKSVIPLGGYCYSIIKGDFIICPYWSIKPNLPEQYNGYCAFLDRDDIEIAEESEYKDMQTGNIEKGSDLDFPTSLLWDQCKECNINMGDD